MQRNIPTRPLLLGGLPPTPGVAISPLTRIYFVDQGTAVALADQNGSVAAPFSTLAGAVAAGTAGVGAVTILIVAGDYSAEVIAPVALNFDWSLIALDLASFQQTAAFVAPADLPTRLPTLDFVTGSAPSVVQLRSVQLPFVNVDTGNSVILTDVNCTAGVNSNLQRSAVKAVRTFFNSSGIGCSVLDCEQCGFWGGGSFVCSGDTIRLGRCYGQTSVLFESGPGFVYADIWSRKEVSFAILTNTTIETECNVQSITGVTTQNQVDSIVTALVALGFVTDDR